MLSDGRSNFGKEGRTQMPCLPSHEAPGLQVSRGSPSRLGEEPLQADVDHVVGEAPGRMVQRHGLRAFILHIEIKVILQIRADPCETQARQAPCQSFCVSLNQDMQDPVSALSWQ